MKNTWHPAAVGCQGIYETRNNHTCTYFTRANFLPSAGGTPFANPPQGAAVVEGEDDDDSSPVKDWKICSNLRLGYI